MSIACPPRDLGGVAVWVQAPLRWPLFEILIPLQLILDKNPQHGIGLITLQVLHSRRTTRAEVGERRRVMEKLIAKSLTCVPLNLRLSSAPSLKANFDMYAVFKSDADDNMLEESDEEDPSLRNIFEDSQLIVDRGTDTALRLDPSDYVVACTGPNRPGTAQNYSERQRSQQILGGKDVPLQVLKPLLSGHRNWGNAAGANVVNLSPYDGCLELAVLSLRGGDFPPLRTFSVTEDVESYELATLRLKKQLLNDWKQCDTTHMPQLAMPYVPQPPSGPTSAIAKPTLKVCEWVEASDANSTLRVSLPVAIRSKWVSDPVHNPEWHDAIAAWDNALRDVSTSAPDPIADAANTSTGPAPLPPPLPVASLPEGWADEPTTASALAEKYTTKVSAATDGGANGTIAITECGKVFAVAGDGEFTYSKMKILGGHGAGDWVKPPRSTDIASDSMSFPFTIADDTVGMVLESKTEGRQTMKDTERCSLRQLLVDMELWRRKRCLQSSSPCGILIMVASIP